EHANKYPWCYAVVGMHPHDSKDMTEEGMEELRRMSEDPKVVAIGEIGLDFHYDLSPRDDQYIHTLSVSFPGVDHDGHGQFVGKPYLPPKPVSLIVSR
ncbi:MAG: TatD family hydrolase, partial [Firmicutes bacterium]|nr:TatD family hydrolase [Bacillota bacterium]